MYYKSCEICGLRSGRQDDQKRTFMAKFPLNEARCKKWVQVIGKEDLAYIPIEKLHELKYVCGNHFRASDFKKKKTQLRKSVVPSLLITAEPLRDEVLVGFPLHVSKNNNQTRRFSGSITALEHNYCRVIDEPKEYTESTTENMVLQAIQTEEHDTSCTEIPQSLKPQTSETRRNTASPTKMLLLKKLNKSKEKLKAMRKKVNDIEKISSPVLKSLIKSAIKNQKRKSNGKRWDDLTKNFTRDLYEKSPEAYRYLSEVMPLPTIKTIKGDINKNKIKASNDVNMANLNETANESDQDDLSQDDIVLDSEGMSEGTQKISICSDEIRTIIGPGVETQGNNEIIYCLFHPLAP